MIDIVDLVHGYYWNNDFNCATTTLLTLGRLFDLEISSQVVDSAVGMHGAGKFGAQCGLVEGSLLFIGILGRNLKMSNDYIVSSCYKFAEGFSAEFKSLQCSDLRPTGFSESDPPHMCEALTVSALNWSCNFIKSNILGN